MNSRTPSTFWSAFNSLFDLAVVHPIGALFRAASDHLASHLQPSRALTEHRAQRFCESLSAVEHDHLINGGELTGGSQPYVFGFGICFKLDALCVGGRLQFTFPGVGLGRRDASVTVGSGQFDLGVGLRIGGLAHGRLQTLVFTLGFELRRFCFLNHDVLTSSRFGQRSSKFCLRRYFVNLGLKPRLS